MIYKIKYQNHDEALITVSVEADSKEDAHTIFHKKYPDCWLMRDVYIEEERREELNAIIARAERDLASL